MCFLTQHRVESEAHERENGIPIPNRDRTPREVSARYELRQVLECDDRAERRHRFQTPARTDPNWVALIRPQRQSGVAA